MQDMVSRSRVVRDNMDDVPVTRDAPRPDLYISADVETDGPIPGPFSLLSFGLVVVGRYDGRAFDRWLDSDGRFYRELQPISDEFQSEALAVNGLDRDQLARQGANPVTAMTEAADWVRSISAGYRPVLVAYPVAFDWAFLYWYFERFADGGSPFGHSSCLDIRTLYHVLAGTVFDRSGKAAMPEFLQPKAPHTHNALEDAAEQGELFANLLEWTIGRRAESAEIRRWEDTEPSWLAPHLMPIA
jgi:DNA polymerase III epsilon subunit-like protein